MSRTLLRLPLLLLLLLVSCNLPTVNVAGDGSGDPAVAQTAIAQAVAQTVQAGGQGPGPSLPQETPLASNTPEPTLTFTPSVPMVSVSVNTNCRTGPSVAYDAVGALTTGETAEVIGRDATGMYWIIPNPDGAGQCWLWGQYATVTGDTSGLPVYTPPPTPTPQAGFAVSYIGLVSCVPQYAFHFEIANTGSVTWESIRIEITDNTTASSFLHTSDKIRYYNGCVLSASVEELTPGEGATATNVNPGQLNYDPTGHSITAIITLCSQNGLAGTCVSRTLNITP